MIGWLQGTVLDTWSQGPKAGVVLNCAGVGYEVQITQRQQGQLEEGDDLILWTHHIQREDASVLFGIPNAVVAEEVYSTRTRIHMISGLYW